MAEGLRADNRDLIRSICEGIKKIVMGLAIKRINWLHGLPSKRLKNLTGKKRGMLVISFPTQALQQRVIKSGIVISAEYFKARLYDHSLTMK